MNRLKRAAFFALAAFTFASSTGAMAGEKLTGSVSSEVTTKGTDWDGKGHISDSDFTVLTLPKGFVFNEKATVPHVLSANGREQEYTIEYADYVEIVPDSGLMAPRTIRVKTHARSPKGMSNAGCRGWMKLRVDFTYVRYAN